MNILFFGTADISVDALNTLEASGILPTLVVTQQDKPQGRNMILTPPAVKLWAEKRNIPVIQPKTLKTEEVVQEISSYCPDGFDVGILISYGKIIPQTILDLPKKGILNIHPSLLPRHRGPIPVHSTILTGDRFGVSIILLDAEMDHGPIVIQKELTEEELAHDSYRNTADSVLAKEGAKLIAEIINPWVNGEISATPQNHADATFCKKLTKADGEIDITSTDITGILRKIRAFTGWPTTYFFTDYNEKRIRVVVTQAHEENGSLVITRVIPEGKKEMLYIEFLRGKKN
jgi:methionyl-tRNA formyltransferase